MNLADALPTVLRPGWTFRGMHEPLLGFWPVAEYASATLVVHVSCVATRAQLSELFVSINRFDRAPVTADDQREVEALLGIGAGAWNTTAREGTNRWVALVAGGRAS